MASESNIVTFFNKEDLQNSFEVWHKVLKTVGLDAYLRKTPEMLHIKISLFVTFQVILIF